MIQIARPTPCGVVVWCDGPESALGVYFVTRSRTAEWDRPRGSKDAYVKDSGDEGALHEGGPRAEVDAEDRGHEVDDLHRGGLGGQVVGLEVLARSVASQTTRCIGGEEGRERQVSA